MPRMGQKVKSLVPKNIKDGDYVLVYWVDIVGQHSGEKKKAELAPCVTGGFFVGYKTSKGKRCLVTADTYHPEDFEDTPFEGYDIYPINVILRVQKLFSVKEIKWPTFR